jgi:membrane protease YdiL (CAAX protease family)
VGFSRKQADLMAVAFALMFPTLLTWLYFVVLAGQESKWQTLTAGLGKVVQFGFPLVWVFLVLREPWKRPAWKRDGVVMGAAFGICIAAAMVALYHFGFKPLGWFDAANEQIRSKVAGMKLDTAGKYLALSLFYPICHSLIEEYYWRWFLFGRMNQHFSLTTAVVVSSLGFMAHHVIVLATFFGWDSPLTYFLSLCVAVGGGVWAWMYARSGSLIGVWISHMFVDGAIFLVGYDIVRPILT